MVFGGGKRYVYGTAHRYMLNGRKLQLYFLYFKSGTPYPRPTILSPYAVVGGRVQQSVSIGRGVSPSDSPSRSPQDPARSFNLSCRYPQVLYLKCLSRPPQLTKDGLSYG